MAGPLLLMAEVKRIARWPLASRTVGIARSVTPAGGAAGWVSWGETAASAATRITVETAISAAIAFCTPAV
jgi:hypothetical protein